MPALNTVSRPIRPVPATSPLRPEDFRYLALQAEIMAERRSARSLSPSALRGLADTCRAKAQRFSLRVA